jgi:hypothetical protein
MTGTAMVVPANVGHSHHMTEMILPDFGQFTTEALVVGRLMAGYGELEFVLSCCVGVVTSVWVSGGPAHSWQPAARVLRPPKYK